MIYRLKQYKKDLDFFIKSNRDFSVQLSRYSRKIKVLDDDSVKPSFYSNGRISGKVHHIAKELKRELEPHIRHINLEMSGKEYEYNYTNNYIGSFCSEEVVNIDMNSAYLTVLHNSGLISDELCLKISDLDKKSRLVLIGLLAYEPEIWFFKDGKKTDVKKEKNPFRNFFFYCVKKVSDAMAECASVCGEDFIFSWVDGIYIVNDSFKKELICELLEQRGFKFSIDICNKFVFEKKEKHIFIEFIAENSEKKTFYIKTDFEKKRIKKNSLYLKYIKNNTEENLINYLTAE